MNHCGTKKIETERLLLRPFKMKDAAEMLKNWIADPHIQHEYGEPVYTSEKEIRALLGKWIGSYQQADFYRWAIIEKQSNQNIGQIAFCRVYSDCSTAEVEYCIGRDYWGRGYAPEALRAIIRFAFSTGDFERIEAYHRVENEKSGRVLQKSTMHLTENIQRFVREETDPEGEICYCIEKAEYTEE